MPVTLCGTPGRRAGDVAAQAFFRASSYVPCAWASATAHGPLAVRFDSAQRRRVAGPDSRSELTTIADAAGLSNPCTKDTPVVAGVASATVANVGRSVHSGDVRTAGFPEEAACGHQVRSMKGLWIRFLHGSGGV